MPDSSCDFDLNLGEAEIEDCKPAKITKEATNIASAFRKMLRCWFLRKIMVDSRLGGLRPVRVIRRNC